MNLLEIMNLKDVYTSPEIMIPLDADGTINKISWESETTNNNSIIIQTCYEKRMYEWTDWKTCVNGSSIPDLDPDTSISHIKFKFRVIMQTKTQDDVPKLKSLKLEFEPILIFDNKGDTYCYPEVWITKIGQGDFSMVNISDNNKEFKFFNLINDETVYVNNERQHIESSIPMKLLNYESFNEGFLKIPFGRNRYRVSGDAIIEFRYQFKLI